jgi:hypothetical protein
MPKTFAMLYVDPVSGFELHYSPPKDDPNRVRSQYVTQREAS